MKNKIKINQNNNKIKKKTRKSNRSVNKSANKIINPNQEVIVYFILSWSSKYPNWKNPLLAE